MSDLWHIPEGCNQKDLLALNMARSMSLQLGLQLGTDINGRYVIQKQIGIGGSSIVYAANDRRQHRMVAFKMFHPVLIEQRDAHRSIHSRSQDFNAAQAPQHCQGSRYRRLLRTDDVGDGID